MGLDIYLYKGDKKVEEQPSAKYPEHYFKVGYFRSSYNDAGINSYARRMELPSLFDIFGYGVEEYKFKPDWNASLERAKDALVKWNDRYVKNKFDCLTISHNMFRAPTVLDESEALKIAEKEISTRNTNFEDYSNGTGTFWKDGIKIFAAIPGFTTVLGKEPCVYLIYESVNLEWYVQAVEIVIETIEFVLAQPKPNDYLFHWSG
jgi:hypothetical protein